MNAYDILMQRNIRPSEQRITIMDYLLNHRTHPTIDEIFNDLRSSHPTLSKTTIYNTLKLFEEKGAAFCLSIDEKNARFDGYTTDHAHFICTKCGKVLDMDIEIAPRISNTHECDINQVHLYAKGVCKKCKEGKDNF